MSAQGLLNSVFSCSSSGSKTLAKRKLQQTRSLDSALMRNGDANTVQRFSSSTAGFTNSQTASEDSRLKQRLSSSSLSTSSDASSISSVHFDYRSGKRNASRDLSLNLSGSSNIFSPRKWLQRKLPQSDAVSHNICKSEVRFWKHAEECCWHIDYLSNDRFWIWINYETVSFFLPLLFNCTPFLVHFKWSYGVNFPDI